MTSQLKMCQPHCCMACMPWHWHMHCARILFIRWSQLNAKAEQKNRRRKSWRKKLSGFIFSIAVAIRIRHNGVRRTISVSVLARRMNRDEHKTVSEFLLAEKADRVLFMKWRICFRCMMAKATTERRKLHRKWINFLPATICFFQRFDNQWFMTLFRTHFLLRSRINMRSWYMRPDSRRQLRNINSKQMRWQTRKCQLENCVRVFPSISFIIIYVCEAARIWNPRGGHPYSVHWTCLRKYCLVTSFGAKNIHVSNASPMASTHFSYGN